MNAPLPADVADRAATIFTERMAQDPDYLALCRRELGLDLEEAA